MTAKDYLGNEILEGSRVVSMVVGYRSFVKGTVFKVNAKKVTIELDSKHYPRKAQQFHNQVIVI